MREFQEKKRFRRILYSKFAVIVLTLCMLFLSKAVFGVYQKERESAVNALRAVNELKKLEDRQALLTSELERLSTDAGIEEEIRAKYGVSKPGEQMLIIIEEDQATSTPIQQQEGWWGRFKKLFK